MSEYDKQPKNIVETLEGNFNFILRAHSEGRLDIVHLRDITIKWAILYKKAIIVEYINQRTKEGTLFTDNRHDHTVVMLGLSRDVGNLLPFIRSEGDQLCNMMDVLIRKEKVG